MERKRGERGAGTLPRPGEMKLFAYAVREFDEKPLFDKWCAKLGVEFAYSTEYPTPENKIGRASCRERV